MADASICQTSRRRADDRLVMTRAELRRIVDHLDRLTAELHRAQARAEEAEAEAAELRTRFHAPGAEAHDRWAPSSWAAESQSRSMGTSVLDLRLDDIMRPGTLGGPYGS